MSGPKLPKSWIWPALLRRYVAMTPVIIRAVAAGGFVSAPRSVGLLGFVRSRLQPAAVTAVTVTRLAMIRRIVEVLSETVGRDPLVSGRMDTTPRPRTSRTGDSTGTAPGR